MTTPTDDTNGLAEAIRAALRHGSPAPVDPAVRDAEISHLMERLAEEGLFGGGEDAGGDAHHAHESAGHGHGEPDSPGPSDLDHPAHGADDWHGGDWSDQGDQGHHLQEHHQPEPPTDHHGFDGGVTGH